MKIIRKYQQGAVFTPISRDLFEWPQQQATQTKSSEEKPDRTINTGIIKALEENGIPVDVDYFLSQAQSFLNESTNIFSSGRTNTMAQLIRIRSLANKVRHNNELFGKAIDRIKTENTGSDVALTDTGYMYVYDNSDQEIKKLSISNYNAHRDQYQALTNNELIHLRERSPELMFDESILHDVSNSVGMKTIMDQVINTIKKFGNIEQSSYTFKIGDQVQKGLQMLIGMGPDGYYSIDSKDSKAAESVNYAIRYLYRNLNSNAKNVLRATTAAEGLDPDNLEDVTSILREAIFEHTDMTRNPRFVKEFEEKKGSSNRSHSSSSDDPSLTGREIWGDFVIKGGGSSTIANIVLPGGNVRFSAPGKRYDSVQIFGNSDGKSFSGPTLANETYSNLVNHGLVDTSRTTYFGEIPLTDISFMGRDIIIDNSKGGYVAYLPVKNGNIDFSMMLQITEIQKEITDNHITDVNKKRQIWENNGFQYNELLDSGVPVYEDLARYWIQPGHTSTAANFLERKSLKGSQLLTEENENIIRNLGQIYNSDPNNENKPEIDLSTFWRGGTAFAGSIFIPLQENQNQTLVLGGQAYMPKPDTDAIKAQQDALVSRGLYNYDTGSYNRSLNGTSASDLD